MKKSLYVSISILAWICIWYFCALIINKPIFLPDPFSILKALFKLSTTCDFWKSIGFSVLGITKGFIMGLLLGIILAILASINNFLSIFIDVPVKVIKSIPVASFVVLALLWVNSKNLSSVISGLMVLPIIYTNLRAAICKIDIKKIQMAKVFRFDKFQNIAYIYIPETISSLTSAAIIATGFAWKSGVAAEIIGLVRNSIGNQIYQSKIYLDTVNLFAWTIALILLSVAFEKIITLILTLIGKTAGGISHDKA